MDIYRYNTRRKRKKEEVQRLFGRWWRRVRPQKGKAGPGGAVGEWRVATSVRTVGMDAGFYRGSHGAYNNTYEYCSCTSGRVASYLCLNQLL